MHNKCSDDCIFNYFCIHVKVGLTYLKQLVWNVSDKVNNLAIDIMKTDYKI